MFLDRAKIYVKGGDGGSGVVSFRREKYVAEGGPNGGDGGRGGNVIARADKGLRTLVDYKYKRHYKAERGQHGQGSNKHGKSAKDLILRVPPGTIIKDADTGEILADIVSEDQEVVLARGGRGGRGNARFVSAQNRVPKIAEKGEPGEERWLELELKLLADVGLIGYPNVGKSTLISAVSAAKPKIADYHFTTLVPNLGVVKTEHSSFVIADIPGLIEGAHQGVGLGHEFLRHVERTKMLVHVIDIAALEGRDPLEGFHKINKELELYDPILAKRKQIIAANKIDLPGAEENLEILQEELGDDYEIYSISAVTGKGLKQLVLRMAELVEKIEPEPLKIKNEKRIIKAPEERFTIEKKDGVFVVKGKEIEKHLAMTDFNNEDAVQRFQRILKKMGVEDALREKAISIGDTVQIGEMEFEFTE
ncbi:MAG: GTPase [Clostridia bacterium]|jgi:GTP-binding protein|nr:GTP-binding protein Obg/CgtA [Clostridiales bacterium]MDK2984487.1 GTPase [Clostridia bacterium]